MVIKALESYKKKKKERKKPYSFFLKMWKQLEIWCLLYTRRTLGYILDYASTTINSSTLDVRAYVIFICSFITPEEFLPVSNMYVCVLARFYVHHMFRFPRMVEGISSPAMKV